MELLRGSLTQTMRHYLTHLRLWRNIILKTGSFDLCDSQAQKEYLAYRDEVQDQLPQYQ